MNALPPEWWADKINDLLFDTFCIEWDSEAEAKLIKIIKEIQDDSRTT